MATPIAYTTKSGEKRYKINVYAGLDDNGKQVTIKKQGFKTAREARLWAAREIAEIEENGLPDSNPDKRTIQQVFDMWFKQYQTTVEPVSWHRVDRLFQNHILPFLGSKITGELKKEDVQELIFYLRDKQPVTYKKNYHYFNKMLKESGYPVREDYFFPAPQKYTNKKLMYPKEEINKILECLKKNPDKRVYAFIRLIVYTGLRKAEAAALEKSKVNAKESYIVINQSFTRDEHNNKIMGNGKSESAHRTIPIDKETLDTILALDYPGPYVFGEFDFNNSPRRWMLKACDELGIKPSTIHGLRHTHCSLLFEASATPKEVQSRLGHANPDITLSVYTHVTEKGAKSASDKFTRYMSEE